MAEIVLTPRTRKAVVSYPVGASIVQKRRALSDGIRDCVAELIELGVKQDLIVCELEQVANDVEAGEVV